MFKYLFCFASTVLGWGGDGHRIITSLAEELISDGASRFLRNHVEDLETASVWADTDAAEKKYPDSNFYHFSNTPYRRCGAFDMKRDCGFGRTKGLCIVTGLRDAIMRSMDPNLSPEIRSDAVKFVVHLMADIHQPLHTGFREDTGGLRIGLSRPNKTDLHYIWDTWLIDQISNDRTAVADQLRKTLTNNNGAFIDRIRAKTNMTEILSSEVKILEYLSTLASDTALTVTCNFGYKNVDGSWIGVHDAIDESYFTERQTVLQVQLLKAVVRLGILMDGISAEFYTRRNKMKAEARFTDSSASRLFTTVDPIASAVSFMRTSNRFGELWLEAPLEEEYTSSDSFTMTLTRSMTRNELKSRKKRSSRDTQDAAMIEAAVDQVIAERQSYTFFGFDLTEIILVDRRGIPFITTRKGLAAIPRSVALPRSLIVHINYGGETVTRKTYHFDQNIFGFATTNDELVIRIMLKLSGVDPRIDITDYMSTIRPVGPPVMQISPVANYLYRTDQDQRRALLEGEGPISTQAQRIRRSKEAIVFKELSDKIIAFVHYTTFISVEKKSKLRQFISFHLPIQVSASGRIQVRLILIDPLIANDRLNLPEDYKELTKFANRNLVSNDQFRANLFWEELLEVGSILEDRNVGLDAAMIETHHRYVEWVYDHHTTPDNYLRVVSWFQIGNFANETELINFFGISNKNHTTTPHHCTNETCIHCRE